MVLLAETGLYCPCELSLGNVGLPEPEPVTEEIIAWRGWLLGRDLYERDLYDASNVRLLSLNHPTIWDGPTLVAHESPQAYNSSGIYALTEAGLLEGYELDVYGTVALSGRVVVGDRGYRAERATVRSLILLNVDLGPWRPIEVMEVLRARYQCEVEYEVRVTKSPPQQVSIRQPLNFPVFLSGNQNQYSQSLAAQLFGAQQVQLGSAGLGGGVMPGGLLGLLGP